ncbi:hypothetical protein I4U23_011381 [Adineta vaga]|nr:hypothetical protein I4U23_011381 [Adineta vaga]
MKSAVTKKKTFVIRSYAWKWQLLWIVGFFFFIILILHVDEPNDNTEKLTENGCFEPKNGKHLCYCGDESLLYDRLLGEYCSNGQIIQSKSNTQNESVLRSVISAIHQSTREKNANAKVVALRQQNNADYVPLKNVSVEAKIHWFAADVTLTHVYINREENPIEAVYIFPIEDNAAIYDFTAEIDNRIIRAVLKEKEVAQAEYGKAVQQGKTGVLLQQSQETLDTFQVNVGNIPSGKECIVKIRYVTELDLIDGKFIRFVIPTTISPRYNPKLGGLQSPNRQGANYVQNTPYFMLFRAQIDRGDQDKIKYIANLSHPVSVSASNRMIEVTSEDIALDRDFILDIDLPSNRPEILVAVEQVDNSNRHAILTALMPTKDYQKKDITITTEFIFIVDCSASMENEQKIGLARQAMLLFVRGLPINSHFNIIRFGSTFQVLFENKAMTTVYNEQTVKQAENLLQSMTADLGGTELLKPLQYLKDHPPMNGRLRRVFLLTDGEVSNTNQVINLCAAMSSTTSIFSFGLGYSPSRSLVKGLAEATKGASIFVPLNSPVDQYVAIQLRQALSSSFSTVRLQWHGLSTTPLQAPTTIPPIYADGRVLVYTFLENSDLNRKMTQLDIVMDDNQREKMDLTNSIIRHTNTIRRLAAKSLIKELQYKQLDNSRSKQIIQLSLTHNILSPLTAFVGIEENKLIQDNRPSQTRYVPIQIAKGDEHLLYSSPIVNNRVSRFLNMLIPVQQVAVMSLQRRPFDKLIITSTTPGPTENMIASLTVNPVRWLIEHQSYNGLWMLNDNEIKQLTNGKAWTEFKFGISDNKDVITTSLVIALLQLKYANQHSLWIILAEKGRNQMINLGLSKDKIDLLIKQIKDKLQLLMKINISP